MFKKILIANRGEIALRIISTCQRMRIGTVAVYSKADLGALHVKEAEESCFIGGADPAESYLRIDNLLDAAKEKGCEAIHPGYGFLSENAEFARRCSDSGIIFIGPSAEAIELMGEKDKAKCVMEKAGVPVVPGYIGEEQSKQFLIKEADKIGYPLIIKAVFGGGGKGLRVVYKKEDFGNAVDSVKNEARKAFGNSRIILESFIKQPRHIEFQVLGENDGNILHLFERDCSVQRRHQKIVEESPSLFIDNKIRNEMAKTAVTAARTVKYTGAGTVEFIVGEESRYYFMEMNTRLQVEHPVTEMVTGLDLVECQLRIAAGEKLHLKQSKIKKSGHSIEARIYAENPAAGFLPSTGKLQRLALPESIQSVQAVEKVHEPFSSRVRIDKGLEEGVQIGIDYDSLMVKMIVHSDTRINAIKVMRNALSQTAILGVETNLGFLQYLFFDRDFEKSQQDTLFLDSKIDSFLDQKKYSVEWVYWIIAVYCFLLDVSKSENEALNSLYPSSPWNFKNSWRTGGNESYRVHLRNLKDEVKEILIAVKEDYYKILNATEEISFSVSQIENLLQINWRKGYKEGLGSQLLVLHHENELVAVHEYGREFFRRVDPLFFVKHEESGEKKLSAPMPGNVIRVFVKEGEKVRRGQQLLVMEAMKIEHTIIAPTDGIVKKVLFKPGELVKNGSELVEFSQLNR